MESRRCVKTGNGRKTDGFDTGIRISLKKVIGEVRVQGQAMRVKRKIRERE